MSSLHIYLQLFMKLMLPNYWLPAINIYEVKK